TASTSSPKRFRAGRSSTWPTTRAKRARSPAPIRGYVSAAPEWNPGARHWTPGFTTESRQPGPQATTPSKSFGHSGISDKRATSHPAREERRNSWPEEFQDDTFFSRRFEFARTRTSIVQPQESARGL